MDKNKICIVIPIYKEVLNDFEIQSVRQCIKILSNYHIYFVYPEDLNIQFYQTKFKEISYYISFNKKYFTNLYSYNRLMLSLDFYKTFEMYSYMLVYQTDCYVFRDDLLSWCVKDYDYIGGVWFDGFENGNPYKNAAIWFAGNGGLSIRKIPTIIKLLSSKRRLKGLKKLFLERSDPNNKFSKNIFKWLFRLPIRLLGYKNNFNYLSKTHTANEDVFFMKVSLEYKAIKIPNIQDAINFSWDRHPAFLYEKFKNIPFGCHAWYRNDPPYKGNRTFWLPIISKESNSNTINTIEKE